MRKDALVVVIILAVIVSVNAGQAQAAWGRAKKSESAAEAKSAEKAAAGQEKKAVAPLNERLIARKAAEKKAKETLAEKEWTIKVTQSASASTKKAKPEIDVLTFSPEGKVTSKNSAAKGYPATNVTVTVQDNGTIIWETMQTNPEVGVLFWRGELNNTIMNGSLTLQPQKGSIEEFYFMTVLAAEEKPQMPQPKTQENKEKKEEAKSKKAGTEKK